MTWTPPPNIGQHPGTMLQAAGVGPDGQPLIYCFQCESSGTQAQLADIPCAAASSPATSPDGPGGGEQDRPAPVRPPQPSGAEVIRRVTPSPPAPPPPAPPPPPPSVMPTPAPPPATAGPPPDRSTRGGLSTASIVTVAASAVLGASAWLDWAFSSFSAFDVPLAYLWGGSGEDPKLGIALVVLGALAAIAAFARWPSIVLRVVSTVAGFAVVAFVIQYATDLSDFGMSWSDVLGEVGIGAWVALVSSTVIGLAARLIRE
jgi:hypothetical protein